MTSLVNGAGRGPAVRRHDWTRSLGRSDRALRCFPPPFSRPFHIRSLSFCMPFAALTAVHSPFTAFHCRIHCLSQPFTVLALPFHSLALPFHSLAPPLHCPFTALHRPFSPVPPAASAVAAARQGGIGAWGWGVSCTHSRDTMSCVHTAGFSSLCAAPCARCPSVPHFPAACHVRALPSNVKAGVLSHASPR